LSKEDMRLGIDRRTYDEIHILGEAGNAEKQVM
jgi:hypothetical protein